MIIGYFRCDDVVLSPGWVYLRIRQRMTHRSVKRLRRYHMGGLIREHGRRLL